MSEYPTRAALTRASLAVAVIAVSVLLHLGFIGAIVMAERRHLTPPEAEAVEVELLQPEIPAEPPKPQEPPKPLKPEALKEPAKPQPPATQSSAKPPEPPSAEPPATAEKPQTPSGGPPSETKAKLTAAEIEAFRAEIQKCWELPVGTPGAVKLEVVLRVAMTHKGELAMPPELLRAPASVHGPRLVGIAMRAMAECAPYRSLPTAKYDEWKVLDLRFLATGPAGLDAGSPNVGRRPKG